MTIEIDQTLFFGSWRRCACAGLRPEARPARIARPQQLRQLQAQFAPEIGAFERCMQPVRAGLPRTAVFLLCSEAGVLLKKIPEERPAPVQPGDILTEESCGPNAAAFALRLGMACCTRPEQNYNHQLSRATLYACPLALGGRPFCLTILTERPTLPAEGGFFVLQMTACALRLESETAALLVCRMIQPESPGEEGCARFSLPELCRKDGSELCFGVEICLDHALTCPLNITNEACTHCTRSGRLNMTGPAVDLQIVPSCGMSLNPAALCLAKTQSGSCGYAFNCDGLGILGGGLGCHSQFWTNREEGGQAELVRLDERSQQLNVRVDATAELPVASGSVPDELVAQATAFHLWNSRPADEISGDLINWPRGAGSITASAVQPL